MARIFSPIAAAGGRLRSQVAPLVLRPRVLFILFALLCGEQTVAAKPRVENGRYYSPDKEFSVGLGEIYQPTNEVSTDRVTIVQLSLSSGSVRGFLSVRSVEWLKLDYVVSKDQYEKVAQTIIADNEAKRLHDMQFEVKNSQLFASIERPQYDFIAVGRYRGQQYAWRGVVYFYGDRIALASEVTGPADINVGQFSVSPDFGFAKWLQSLRREGDKQRP